LFGVPIFYLPYLRHPMSEAGRESGFMPPVASNGSSIRGYTFGEQFYWVINRSMDMVVGSEYFSKRGWAPSGDFRYKGLGLDHLEVRWTALLDRGIDVPVMTGSTQAVLVNQGGLDITAVGRKELTPETRITGKVEFLSSYLYRLVFNDNYWQAISSEVQSNVFITHVHNGFIPSAALERFQTFAGSTNGNASSYADASAINGNQARILHLPSLRFDVLDRPLAASGIYWGLGSSLGYLGRSLPSIGPSPSFHARNVGRFDFYPHLSFPVSAGGWNMVPEAALRLTTYSISQTPYVCQAGPINPCKIGSGNPTIRHSPLQRTDVEASIDLRAPTVVRDFELTQWNRELRHVIEPEFFYKYVTGIGKQTQNVLPFDTTDIATNTNELGYSLTQRFFVRPVDPQPCSSAADCHEQPREWASWQIAQKYLFDSNFGGALIPNQRNIFDSTLDLSAVAFLTSARNLSPVTSRLRFEAINNLRIQWDLDYDLKTGRLAANNIFAGYSWGRTTAGLGHSLLDAVAENGRNTPTVVNQQVQPFLEIGKPTGVGFDLALNSGYDLARGALQYAGAEAVYNWDCCGLTFGYRRFQLGVLRDETQYLYGFTLANFGSVGDVSRSKSVFRDRTLPPVY
jgi:LPS-assembly protein